MTDSRFAYIWEYRVKPSSEAAFLKFYGPGGAWFQLFRRGEGYLGTDLFQDDRERDRFVTVDRWESKVAFRAFRMRFGAEFEQLDEQGEALTLSETPLGEFTVCR
jgi:heme-degrading monooxygenase HmoA